ncbi:MAG TPA: hypothetical protein ENI88_04470 [Desulfobulbus sp.]|nr:hypothetical protein [Desulfobulbus sp.]
MFKCTIIHRSIVIAAMLAGLLSVCIFAATVGATVTQEKNAARAMREKWGIEVTSLRMAVAGHMVDFRYRVLDPGKAETLFVRSNKPYLIDQASQKVLAVPNLGKVGPLRTSNKPQQGRIYWMFFGNGGGLVHPGSKITVIIGDFRVENLVVQ